MKKLKFLFLFLLICVPIFLVSCSSETVKMSVDLDTHSMILYVPTEYIASNADDIVNENKELSIERGDKESAIVVDLSSLETTPESQNDLLSRVASLIPSLSTPLNGMTMSVNTRYFGTELFGTEYFDISISSPVNTSIDLTISSKYPFMFNGNESILSEGKHSMNVRLNLDLGNNMFEFQRSITKFSNLILTIDVSRPSPYIKYEISYNASNSATIKEQINSIGMSVEYCDENRAVFSETYDTHADFESMFPIRTYSLFNIVTALECKLSSMIMDRCDMKLSFFSVSDDQSFTLSIIGQDKTSFLTNTNGVESETESNLFSTIVRGNTEIDVNYQNVRWNVLFTCIGALLIISLVVVGMVFVAKKKL